MGKRKMYQCPGPPSISSGDQAWAITSPRPHSPTSTPGDFVGSWNWKPSDQNGFRGQQEEPDGDTSLPSVPLGILFRLRPAPASGSLPPIKHLICRKRRWALSRPSSYPETRGPEGTGQRPPLGPGRFCLLGTFHFYRARSCSLASSQLPAMGAGFTLPASLPSSSFLGMCLPLRVPVAAWKWLRPRRVTKRGSPAPRLQRLLDWVRAIFEAIADHLMNHSKHTWPWWWGQSFLMKLWKAELLKMNQQQLNSRPWEEGKAANYTFLKYRGAASGAGRHAGTQVCGFLWTPRVPRPPESTLSPGLSLMEHSPQGITKELKTRKSEEVLG